MDEGNINLYEVVSHQALIGIQKENLEFIWPRILPLLQRSLDKQQGRFTSDHVYAWLLESKMQLWVAVDTLRNNVLAVCLTEIVNYPNSRRLSIPCIAADKLGNWTELLDIIISWAKIHKCSMVELNGSRAWIKIFKKYNFEAQSVLMTAPIN